MDNWKNKSGNFEIDKMYWFVEQKGQKDTRENIYLITMISQEPRQIVGFFVTADKSSERIQSLVDSALEAENTAPMGIWDMWMSFVTANISHL